MKGLITCSLLAAFILTFSTAAMGQGFVVVEGSAQTTPVEVRAISIQAEVTGLTAKVRVEEVFFNTTNRDLEGTFLLPVPEGSAFQSFSMDMEGSMVEGNLTDAKSAAETYRRIVSRLKDPGLLEFLGTGLYRFSIYPIPAKGTKTIVFEYTVPLEKKGGSVRLVIPLKSSGLFRKPVAVFDFAAEIDMPFEIANISSTAYDIDVSYSGAHSATVRLARSNVIPRSNLEILIQSAEGSLSNTFMTCRGEDGGDFFCMELSPGRIFKPEDIQPKDVTYILDVSGSMQGHRIEAAKKALIRSVALLNSSDRYRLVLFESDARFSVEYFTEVSEDSLKDFEKTVRAIHVGGGTNMQGGLFLGLRRAYTERQHCVVLVSDGYPGPGLSGDKELADYMKDYLDTGSRLYTLGVGGGVNQFLLDQLAVAGGGFSGFVPDDSYVAEGITDFMRKLSSPVFKDVKLEFEGIQVWDLVPENSPALYAGKAIRLFGRFRSVGETRVRLSGTYLGKEEVFTYDFSGASIPSPHLPALWASRRAAALLDKIQLEGKSELEEEVIELAGRYGIVTPYTSYFVTENGRLPQDAEAFLQWWNARKNSGAAPAGSAPAPTNPGATVVSGSSANKMFGKEIDPNDNTILFVLDVSGSMKESCGVSGPDAGLSKLEYARKELARVIRNLPSETKFNIIAFSSDVRQWSKTFAPAKPGNQKDAVRFLDSLVPSGETYMTKAFETAFESGGPEAIYFISDGKPHEKGKPVKAETVIEKVEFLNRFRKASIHTIGFKGVDIELMKALVFDGAFRFVGQMEVEPPKWRTSANDPLSKCKDTPEVRLVRKLLGDFSASSLRKMLELAVKTREHNTIKAVKAAIRSLDNDKHRKTVCSALTGSGDYKERVILAEIVGTYRQYPRAVDSLVSAGLKERSLQALKMEVIALSASRDKKAVTGLGQIWLSLEKKKKGAGIVAKIKRAIASITGVSGIGAAVDFLKWWKVAQTSFHLPSAPGSTGVKGPEFLGKMRQADTAEAVTRNTAVVHVESKTFVKKGEMWVDTLYKEAAPFTEVPFLSEKYWEIAGNPKWAKYLAVGQSVLVCLDKEAVRIVPARGEQ